jgi:hypothetical protein
MFYNKLLKSYIVKKIYLLSIVLFLSGIIQASPGIDRDTTNWKKNHYILETRLRALVKKEGLFGESYRPIYHAALPWYEVWDIQKPKDVDTWMVSPEIYTTELADALEHGRNYFAENQKGVFPMVFEKQLPDGKVYKANYLLSIPSGFPENGHQYPLVITLHGTGWLGHKISFIRNGKSDKRVFQVTPINEGGPWQLDFLNAFYDELIKMLPIDQDHVYLDGHSLGAMATWEWAMNNPERFAAISPRSGIGEPYRAIRLKNVPVWVIHGENDNVILSGYSDQMTAAIQACGGSVKYSLLKGVEHNMPYDLNDEWITDWYLHQTRSHNKTPDDPRNNFVLTPEGYTKWEVSTLPTGLFWKSEEIAISDGEPMNPQFRNAIKNLFKKANDMGELVDGAVRYKLDTAKHIMNLWLPVPKTTRVLSNPDTAAISLNDRKVVRFYFNGEQKLALRHIKDIASEVKSAGYSLSDKIWITQLSARRRPLGSFAEYCVEIE